MILIAAFFYLPAHVAEMLRRAWFYYAGDETVSTAGTASGPRVAAVGEGSGALGTKQGMNGGSGPRRDGQDVLDMLGRL